MGVLGDWCLAHPLLCKSPVGRTGHLTVERSNGIFEEGTILRWGIHNINGREANRTMIRLNRKGFTLVEIMIVVAIIALLAAIAIPNLLRARHNANETAAIGAMRTLSSALESFRAAQTPPAYPDALDELSDADPPYVDATLGAGTRQGYTFTYAAVGDDNEDYTITGNPVNAGVTGTRVFFVDSSGVIRLDDADGDPLE